MSQRPPVIDWSTDFDHLDPRWTENPYPIWDELRQKCPIAHTDRFMGAYFATRYEDVRTIAYDTEHFSSRRPVVRETRPPLTPAPPITSDPPEHWPAKQVLLPTFTPEAIKRHEPRTRDVCQELIARIAHKQSCDAAVEYAQEIPVRVIAHMLGVPEQDAEQFRKWIKEILEFGISDYDVLMRAQREMIEYFADKIAIRRADPQEDLISYLINAHFENRVLSDDHINGTLRLLLIAGIDTTWSAIGSCLWHLAQHREDLRRLRSESGLMTSAIEEFLRAYAPVTMAREVVKETQIGGCTFKFGQGDREGGLDAMRRGIAACHDMGNLVYTTLLETALAEAEAEAGEIEAALASIDRTVALTERTGQRWNEADTHRVRGEILFKRDPVNTGPAENAFLSAIAVAQQQKARSFQLRAALSLAKLYYSTDRAADAHAVLAPALEGFVPTPEMPEIGEAQALLEVLEQDEAVKAHSARRERRVQLQLAYGAALISARGYGAEETVKAFDRARQLSAGVGGSVDRLALLHGTWLGAVTTDSFEAGRKSAAAFLAEATQARSGGAMGVAHRAVGATLLYGGLFHEAKRQFDEVTSLLASTDDAELARRFNGDPRAAAHILLRRPAMRRRPRRKPSAPMMR